jgi:hypothetical protein
MKTIQEFLKLADPLERESVWSAEQRQAVRNAVVSASGTAAQPAWNLHWQSVHYALIAVLALAVAVSFATGMWSHAVTPVQAAVHFEVRLAETSPAAGLREVAIPGENRSIYLHSEAVVTNSDIARTAVIPGNTSSTFFVDISFTPDGGRKMQIATEGHLGRPVAIMIDDKVVAAPTVRSVIGDAAVINGSFTRAEAERIANGIDKR